jgi:hypothetical protein
LKTTLAHVNCTHEEVKKQISSMEHLLYFATEYFIFPLLSKNIKIETCRTVTSVLDVDIGLLHEGRM